MNNRQYLYEDLAQIQKYFPGATPTQIRTPFELTPKYCQGNHDPVTSYVQHSNNHRDIVGVVAHDDQDQQATTVDQAMHESYSRGLPTWTI